ncbi:MAG TPA: hypothetical protein ENL27_01260 [Candidatus Parcubacteria bacterium]|nr:hypothetical protein [Candidatus Parcubacteria bacterium]
MLPKKAIDQFKELYKKRYNIELSDKEAEFRANNIINLYKAVYIGPISESNQVKLKDQYGYGKLKLSNK